MNIENFLTTLQKIIQITTEETVGAMMIGQPGFIKPCIFISRANVNIAHPIQFIIST